jgi:hypothetical protein
MPVEFLSQERRERLGRFSDDPTAEQLARYFHLDDADRALVERRARERTRLGFALQLGTVRFLGTFLADPTDVPRVVVDYVAASSASPISRSPRDTATGRHAGTTRRRSAGRTATGTSATRRSTAGSVSGWRHGRGPWASARACCSTSPSPGCSSTRSSFRARPCSSASSRRSTTKPRPACGPRWRPRRPRPPARQALEGLLVVPPGARRSGFDRLRQGPRAPSAAGITAALHRLEEVRALGVDGVDLAGVPQGRLQALARFTAKARAQTLGRMGPERRLAHLVAFAATLETTALDDVLDAFDLVVGELLGRAAPQGGAGAAADPW